MLCRFYPVSTDGGLGDWEWFVLSPSTQGLPTKLLAHLDSRFSVLSLTAQTMARSLSLKTC